MSKPNSQDAGRGTVLVVEDDLGSAATIRLGLQAAGYDVVHRSTVAYARAALTDRRFRLAILGAELPDGDALDLLPELDALGLANFMVTGWSGPAEQLERRGCAVLRKPFTFEQLHEMVHAVLATADHAVSASVASDAVPA